MLARANVLKKCSLLVAYRVAVRDTTTSNTVLHLILRNVHSTVMLWRSTCTQRYKNLFE